jgi:FKBP-type peptidyl-prolyl cis-trans isomerase FklB
LYWKENAMKPFWVISTGIVLLACQSNTQQTAQLKTQQDSISYMIGMDIGKNLQAQSIDVDPDLLAQGIKDVLANKTMMTDQEAQHVAQQLQSRMMAKQEEKMKESSEKNKKEGDAFLAANKKKPGVVTLPSGLQYKVIKKGTGKKPKETETVSVHYRGTLIDGTLFDNSYDGGQPVTFPVNGVIKGWTEALQLMPVGSKWELYIPSNLAYGEQGVGQVIGPNQTLIFEVELLSVK